jgi:hypothetical protein
LVKTNGNLKEAGLRSGYSESYASGHICELTEDNRFVREYESNLTKALKRKGIDDEKLSQVVDDGLNANRLRTFKGEVLGEEPDNFIRHRYLETILKVRGDFAPDQINVKVGREQAEDAFKERVKRMKDLENGQEGASKDAPEGLKTEEGKA